MRIAIDARLNAYRRGGIPQYTRQLLTALAEIAPDEHFISLQHRDMLRPLAVAPNVSRRTVYTPPHHRYEQWTLPLEVWMARPDVLHSPDFIAPLRRPCPAVITIHDLAFKHYPGILDDSARQYYGQIATNAARADAVIAVSEATRQDVAQFLDIPVNDVKVIYEAAAPLFRHIELRPGEARVLNGKPVAAGAFMLFVSTLEPRKNLPTLLQALRICADRRPDRPYKLVIIGGRGWNDEPIFQTIRDLRLADYVMLPGSVGQYDLRWLYNACQFYINPSLYEGFGLPLLEAMACGAACLAAATSSLPEIGGDAALYVPPLEPDQWANAIEALWDDNERQQELGRIGLARAQRFSWARAARETLQVYRQAQERYSQPATARPQVVPHQRRTMEPPQPAVVLPSSEATIDERTCLRCGTLMQPGELQQHLRMHIGNEDGGETSVLPRAWACPNCGYAELVVERLAVPVEQVITPALDASAPARSIISPVAPPESAALIAVPDAPTPLVIQASDSAPAEAITPIEAVVPDAEVQALDHVAVDDTFDDVPLVDAPVVDMPMAEVQTLDHVAVDDTFHDVPVVDAPVEAVMPIEPAAPDADVQALDHVAVDDTFHDVLVEPVAPIEPAAPEDDVPSIDVQALDHLAVDDTFDDMPAVDGSAPEHEQPSAESSHHPAADLAHTNGVTHIAADERHAKNGQHHAAAPAEPAQHGPAKRQTAAAKINRASGSRNAARQTGEARTEPKRRKRS